MNRETLESEGARRDLDDVVRAFRSRPECLDFVRDTYWDDDVFECGKRFTQSAEFLEVLDRVGGSVAGLSVVDIGAGRGIASFAFAGHGANRVFAIEPDPSQEIGRGAIQKLVQGLPIVVVEGCAEQLPLADASVDVVYARQVLHHVRDLEGTLREANRVLKNGGTLLACREHVVNDERELKSFLRDHPTHKLVGNEHAYPLERYVGAIRDSGLKVTNIFGPWDTVINAFPAVRSQDELRRFAIEALAKKFGRAGYWLGRSRLARESVLSTLNRYTAPGRMYSFLAKKP